MDIVYCLHPKINEFDPTVYSFSLNSEEYEKHNQEMVSNLASMLFKNTENIEKMSYNKARRPDGTENTELTITMKPPSVDQPPVDDDDDHTDEIMVSIDALKF